MLKKPGFSHSCKAVAAGSAILLCLCLVPQAQAGPRIEFGDDGGFLQIDLKGQFYVENTNLGAGTDGRNSRTDFHFMRNRLGMTGMLNETWGYKFQTCGNTGTTKNPFMYALSAQDTDWNDRDVRIIDAYAIANFTPAVNFKVGLTKIPLTRANLDDCFAPLSQDRSMFAYSAFGSSPAKFSRDLGGVAYGRFLNDRLTYFAGVFQGREGTASTTIPVNQADPRFTGTTAVSSNAPKTNLEYVGRLTFDFLDSEGGSGYQGTYFGEKKVFNIGAGVAYQPNAAYKSTSNVANYADPTNTASSAITKVGTQVDASKGTVDYVAYAVDMMFEYPTPFGVPTITAQYLKVDFEDAYLTTSSADKLAVVAGLNGQKEGFYVKAAHILPFSIGSVGKLQPYGLYENWRFAHLLGIDNQRIEQYGGGLNYYITGDQRVRLTGEYLKTAFTKATAFVVPGVGSPGAVGFVPGVKSFDTFRMMLQLVF